MSTGTNPSNSDGTVANVNTMTPEQFEQFVAENPNAVSPDALSPEKRRELDRMMGVGVENDDVDASSYNGVAADKRAILEGVSGLDGDGVEDAINGEMPEQDDPKAEAATVPEEAMLAVPGEGTSATDAYQEYLDEQTLDANFEGYQSPDKTATIDAIKATYGQDADINDIAATAKKDIEAADDAMKAAGVDPATVTAEAIVVSTQKASPTAMGSHIMNKSKSLDLFGLTDKAGLTMADVNKAFKVAMRQPDADRSALMNARSLLRADLSAQGTSMQPAPELGSSHTP